ncbi:hypothetical protein B296_00038412 [Ensete ventricosum]|uniref:Uncharacterized protein n=1 Tax=Ensete ventricosum TaxID=4639 RepID=A0A426ZDQ9_ENSVE|nr:hypothetical protein B296_00038412 [Ensete ventricosum]
MPLCGHRATGDCCRCGLAAARRACRRRPLRAGLARGLVVGGRPCMGAGHGWSPLCLCENVARMRRTILRDTISSHAV